MWSLPKPHHTAWETYEAAVSRIRNPELKSRHRAAIQGVSARAADFATAAEQGTVHTLATSAFEVPGLSNDEMVDLYELRMARKQAPARHVYDAIRSAPPHGRCPMCGHRDVSTLDHYLPKSGFSALTVTPLNLVPACHECNKTKGDRVASSRDTSAIHPYFDDFDTDCWLRAAVVEQRPPAVQFYVDAPACWSSIVSAHVIPPEGRGPLT